MSTNLFEVISSFQQQNKLNKITKTVKIPSKYNKLRKLIESNNLNGNSTILYLYNDNKRFVI